METKKLLASVAVLAMTANLAFAGLSFADTGETTIEAGSYTLALSDGGTGNYNSGSSTLTYYYDSGGSNCASGNGNISASTSDQTVCADFNYLITDTEGNSGDTRAFDMTWSSENFASTSSSSTFAITGGQMTVDMQAVSDLSWSPNSVDENTFDTVVTSDHGVIDTNAANLLTVTEGTAGGANAAYDVSGNIVFSLTVPGGTPSETFQNTVTFANN